MIQPLAVVIETRHTLVARTAVLRSVSADYYLTEIAMAVFDDVRVFFSKKNSIVFSDNFISISLTCPTWAPIRISFDAVPARRDPEVWLPDRRRDVAGGSPKIFPTLPVANIQVVTGLERGRNRRSKFL